MAWKQFARRIKGLRDAKGWSQNQLATRAGLRAADLSRILTGSRNVMPHHITALAGALELSVDDLVDGTGMGDVLEAQVPIARLEEVERARAELHQHLDELRGALGEARDAVLEARRSLGNDPAFARVSGTLAQIAVQLAAELRPATAAKPSSRPPSSRRPTARRAPRQRAIA